jgi:uncharacterized cupin superfamily protein
MSDDAISGPVADDGTRLPFSVEDVPWEEYSHGTRFGTRFRQLGDYGGCSHVGVCMEEIAPGRQAYVAHYHMLEEEQLLVLQGRPTLRLGDETFDLEPGSYVVFPAGQKAGHALVNRTEETVRYLIIGERNPNEVTVHTDTGRVGVRLIGEGYHMADAMGYWDGEDAPGAAV